LAQVPHGAEPTGLTSDLPLLSASAGVRAFGAIEARPMRRYNLGGTSTISGAGAGPGTGAVTTVRSGGSGSLLRESSGSPIKSFVETVDTVVETIDATRADANLVKAITTGVLDGITRLGLTERHSEVLEAITNVTVQPPDLAAVVDEITSLKGVVAGGISNVVVEPTNIGPIKQIMQELRGEIRVVGEELRRDFQNDLAVLQQELLANRKETRSDAEALLEEVHKIPEQLSEVNRKLRAVERKDNAEVLRAIGGISFDEQAVATSVIDKLRRTTLKVDQEDVLQAISRVSTGNVDPEQVARAVHERKDNAEVLRAIGGISFDEQAVATSVIDKLRRTTLKVDQEDVLQAISRVSTRNVDPEQVARAVHERIIKVVPTKDDHIELVNLVQKIKRAPEVDLSPVHDAIGRINLKVDHAPVLEAINGIGFLVDQVPVLEAIRQVSVPDAEAIATLVHDRIKQTQFTVLRPEVDFSTVHASLRALTDRIDDILRHLAELRSEAWRLREVHVVEKPPQVVREVRIENPRPKVVQPMLQSPVVQATAVVPATTAMVPATTAVVPATTTLVQTMASSPVTICCHCGNHYMDDSNFCRMCGKPRDLATPGMEMDLSLSPSTPW